MIFKLSFKKRLANFLFWCYNSFLNLGPDQEIGTDGGVHIADPDQGIEDLADDHHQEADLGVIQEAQDQKVMKTVIPVKVRVIMITTMKMVVKNQDQDLGRPIN